MTTKTIDFSSWLTYELFEYLVGIGTIPDDEDFEDWKNERTDMLKICKNEN